MAILALVLVEAALIVLIILRALGLPGLSVGAPSPSARAASPNVSPSILRSPSPSRSATPTADAFAAARSRLAEMRAAIDAATGPGGLKNKEGNDLLNLTADVDEAIQARDADKASEAADKLVEEVRKDIEDRDVTGSRAQRLLDAAKALQAAIP